MNMNAKKRVNGSWVDAPYYIHKTAADTFTTFPVDVYADGNNATVGLKGNTVQSGTPTLDSLIIPQGTGDLETSGEKAGQYKIPISSANTTTTVYLGEVESTRRIKKLVLTGEENWYSNHLSANLFNLGIDDYVKNTDSIICLCTHYKAQKNITLWTNVQDKSVCFFDTTNSLFYLRDSNFSTVADLKSYLTQQYANGTPVTVWYVLATPETGVVNEPLMKIGNYADEVSNISIPTITGKNIVDVETVLKPSEVSFNYAGWHTAVVHKRINGAWD